MYFGPYAYICTWMKRENEMMHRADGCSKKPKTTHPVIWYSSQRFVLLTLPEILPARGLQSQVIPSNPDLFLQKIRSWSSHFVELVVSVRRDLCDHRER